MSDKAANFQRKVLKEKKPSEGLEHYCSTTLKTKTKKPINDKNIWLLGNEI